MFKILKNRHFPVRPSILNLTIFIHSVMQSVSHSFTQSFICTYIHPFIHPFLSLEYFILQFPKTSTTNDISHLYFKGKRIQILNINKIYFS